MQRPIFMLVSGDEPRLGALGRDLSRRYEADYEVVCVTSAGAALTMLADVAASGAAIYAASEGPSTLLVEPDLPGGQAGTSSLIRNYLGFPHGLSGEPSPTGLSNRRGCSARTPCPPGRTP